MRLSIVLVLVIIQGFAELLPISSSAHVIIAERILGLDPTIGRLSFLANVPAHRWPCTVL